MSNVPFYANTPDDTHCYQAALKMVLGYFEPDEQFSWEFLDDITHKLPDMWTWPMSGLAWLQQRGYKVRNIEDFDYSTFAVQGKTYLEEKYGQEVANASAEHSDIDSEKEIAKQFYQTVHTDLRLPDYTEVIKFIDDGYLVITNVNARVLSRTSGYAGHFVVITGYDDHSLVLHDPGLPALAHRVVSTELFQSAWAYPDDYSKNIMAIKKL